MLSKNQISHVKALHRKKVREEEKLFIAEGGKTVLEILASSITVTELYAVASFFSANEIRPGIACYEVKPQEMERITALSTPSPVLAVCTIPDRTLMPEKLLNKLVLVLDDIRDPGNLGTIVRVADWFGISAVVCSETSVDLYNPKVVQATMGSITRVPVFYTSISKFIGDMKSQGMPVYGTFLNGNNIYSQKLSPAGLIVIGNESNGISREVEELIEERLMIPSFSAATGGEAESLNAAIATAVICSEFRRR